MNARNPHASSPGTAATSLDALLAQAAEAAVERAAARLARPTHVSQRTVAEVVGMLPGPYLTAARGNAFTSWKQGRLIFARTEDVVGHVESHPTPQRAAKPANDGVDDIDAALARVGARRVSA